MYTMVYDEYKLPINICYICFSTFTGNGTCNGTYDVTMWWYLLIFMLNVDRESMHVNQYSILPSVE